MASLQPLEGFSELWPQHLILPAGAATLKEAKIIISTVPRQQQWILLSCSDDDTHFHLFVMWAEGKREHGPQNGKIIFTSPSSQKKDWKGENGKFFIIDKNWLVRPCMQSVFQCCFLKQGLTIQPWLVWNSLCRSGQPQICINLLAPTPKCWDNRLVLPYPVLSIHVNSAVSTRHSHRQTSGALGRGHAHNSCFPGRILCSVGASEDLTWVRSQGSDSLYQKRSIILSATSH